MTAKRRYCKRISILLAILALWSLLALPAQVLAAAAGEDTVGTTYYVSPEGDDDNDGKSPATAWKSLARVSAQRFEPGDQILLDAKGVWNERLILEGTVNGQGTAQAPILVSKYNSDGRDDRPVINGGAATMADARTANMDYIWVGAIELWNMDYWHVEGIEVTNLGTARDTQRIGIWVMADVDEPYAGKTDSQKLAIYNASVQRKGVQIRDCYVHDVNGAYEGTTISNGSGGTMSANKMSGGICFMGKTDAYVTDCHVKDVSCEGIRNAANSNIGWAASHYSTSVEVVFRNNHVEQASGDGMVLSSTYTGVAEYNVVRAANYYNSGRNYAALWLMGANNTVVQYNEVFDTRYAAGDGEAFDFDSFCNNSLYQYNYSHNNCGGVILVMPSSSNNVFRYNISVNDGRTGAGRNHLFYYTYSSTTSDTAAALFHNNVFVVGPSTGVLFDSSNNSNRIKFYNNIVMSVSGNVPNFSSGTFTAGAINNNIFYPGALLSEGSYSAGIASGNQFVNPGLARPGEEAGNVVVPLGGSFNASALDAYKVSANSPAIGAGVDVRGITPAKINELFPLTVDLFGNAIDFDNVTVGVHQYSDDAPENTWAEELPEQVLIEGEAKREGVEGSSLQLSAQIGPDTAWNRTLVWSSDNDQVASVSAVGTTATVYLNKEGTAVITAASAANPEIKASVTVSVQAKPTLEKIVLESDRLYISEEDGGYPDVQLSLYGLMTDGQQVALPQDNIAGITYTLDEAAQSFAAVDKATGRLAITGDVGDAESLTVYATVAYENYLYTNSFEAGNFGDMQMADNATIKESGTVGVAVGKGSAVKAHDGEYALVAQAASISNSNIRKVFNEAQYGTVSMWFYDDLEGTRNSNLKMGIAGNVVGNNLNNYIGVYHENNATQPGYTHYVYRINGASSWTKSAVARSTGWHEFVWEFGADKLTMYIDGIKIAESAAANKGFSVISVATNWAANNGAAYGRVFFDDIRYWQDNATRQYVTQPVTIYLNPTEPLQIDVAAEGGKAVVTRPGGTLQMSCTVLPENIEESKKGVLWSVESISGEATIDENGLLTSVKAGTVRVIATSAAAPAVQGSLEVTLKEGPTLMESVAVSSQNGVYDIDEYQGGLQFTASYMPREVDDEELVWTVTTINYDPTEWAVIDQNGYLRATGIRVDDGTPVLVRATNPASGKYGEVRVNLSNQFAPAQQVGLVAAGEDTYVRPGTNAGNNYGSKTDIEIKEVDTNYVRRGLLKFDVSDLDAGEYDAVVLRLYVDSLEYGSWKGKTGRINVFAISDDWAEATVTYSSLSPELGMPPPDDSINDAEEKQLMFDGQYADYLGALTITTPQSGGFSGWIELDVTQYLLAHPELETLSIGLIGQHNSQCLFRIATREGSAETVPQLGLYRFPQADKSALQAKVDEVLAMDSGLYTAASWAEVSAALGRAQLYLADEDVGQAELDYALAALEAALAALVEKAPAGSPTVVVKPEEKYTRPTEGGYTMVSFKLYDENKVVGYQLNDGAYMALTPNKNSDVNYIKVGGSLKGAVYGLNTLKVYDALGNVSIFEFVLVQE